MKNYNEFIENEKQKLAIKPEAAKKAWINQMHDTFVGLCVNDVEDVNAELYGEFEYLEDVIGTHKFVTLFDAFLYGIEFLVDNDICDPEPETMYEVTKNYYNILECVNYESMRWEEEEE